MMYTPVYQGGPASTTYDIITLRQDNGPGFPGPEEVSQMKYMITFPMSMATFHERVARFLETGGSPPEGVTMHGRWHSLGGDIAFVLASTDDPKGIYKWLAGWGDLIEFDVTPVIEDDEAAPILQELKL